MKQFVMAGSLLLSLIACVAPIKSSGLVGFVAETEKRLDARIGLAAYDYHSGRRWEYNANDRFPITSTFKALACAAVLARVDAGAEDLQSVVIVKESDLVPYAPVTERRLGGPEGITAFARRIGDSVTRLDRWETELNQAKPGDPQDTTTPNAMLQNLRGLLFGGALSTVSRRQFKDWLAGNKVGGPLIRAGLPDDWRVGDRTGAGGYGSRSVIAVIWPPERRPVIVALYMTETTASLNERNAAIAGIAGALKKELLR